MVGFNVDMTVHLVHAKCNMNKSSAHPIDYMRSQGYLL